MKMMKLFVPKFDFNWQHTYTLTKPLAVPAGTQLVVENRYDNSAENVANPDPTATVYRGEQAARRAAPALGLFRRRYGRPLFF